MNEERQDLRDRTRDFALRVIRLYALLQMTTAAQVKGKLVLRSGTSVGAHYREATRARSTAKFVSKLGGGLQEVEESIDWFEWLIELGLVVEGRLKPLCAEANELVAIFVTCIQNAKLQKNE